MIIPRVKVKLPKNNEVIIFYTSKNSFLMLSMGAIGYSYSIRLVPTYILPAIEIRLL